MTLARSLALGIVLLGSLTSSVARAAPLPEGDTGLAAKHPNDIGLASDPEVVMTEDFEAVTGSVLTVGPKWDNVYGKVAITQTPANVHGGTRAAEIVHLTPENTHGAWRDFGTSGYDELYLRYYMKFDAAFPGVHHQGMGIFGGAPGVDIGSSTGVASNGTNHFTVLLDDIDPNMDWSPSGNATPGFQYVYCYHMDQGSQWGDVFLPTGDISPNQRKFSGSGFTSRPNVIPPRDKWIAYELMVHANTPGQADGRIAFWIDGALKADFPGLRFRSTTALKENFVILSSYASTQRPNQRLWYDDIVVAKSYIGPRTTGAPSGSGSAGSGGSGGGSPSGGSAGSADAGAHGDAGMVSGSGASPDGPDPSGADARADGVSPRRASNASLDEEAAGCQMATRRGNTGFAFALGALIALGGARRRSIRSGRRCPPT